MKEYENIVLIGMPASGKSVVGRLLAKEMDYHFLDTDQYIEQETQKTLQQILDEKGRNQFCKIEEKCILDLLPLQNYVIAPGGSAIYSEEVMEALHEKGVVIFLLVALKELQSRLENKETRGIVGLKESSLGGLYEERQPLYMKYADIIVSCTDKTPAEIIKEIKKNVGIKGTQER